MNAPLNRLELPAAFALVVAGAAFLLKMCYLPYFGGQRIRSKHDAPNDLQWDFAGILIGALLAYMILRRGRRVEAATAT